MMPVTPIEFSQAATSSPSNSQYRFQYPPPGQMIMAVPESLSPAARPTVIDGLVTLVIIRVDSVTSTWERSSFGDGRTYSAPMVPGSSGGLPGQRSRTSGLSAAAAAGPRLIRRQKVRRWPMMEPEMQVRIAAGDWPPSGRRATSDADLTDSSYGVIRVGPSGAEPIP